LKDGLTKPVACVLHLAGVLADGMIPTMTRESFDRSYGPKVLGLYNLVSMLDKRKDNKASYLLFSSTSALFGSPGQANYSASNSVMDSLAPWWVAKGERIASTVQWGPWAEVGMATGSNTLARGKAMGVGALSNALGMTIMGSILGSNDSVVGACHVRWGKYLKAAYPSTPSFLEVLEEEALKDAPVKPQGEGTLANLVGLSVEDRLVAVREAITHFAREVVDNPDLSADAPLLDSGMDSLSGVEFRNRLAVEFEGVKLANSVVFDHPTIEALSYFINGQLGDVMGGDAAPAAGSSAKPAPIQDSGSVDFIEKVNDRKSGTKLFVVPGAGLQAGGFRAMASLMPIEVHSLTWPKGKKPRAAWPATLLELAQLYVTEIQRVQPVGPYYIAGHSFGANVCLEISALLEETGNKVALVALLDPRHLSPVESDVGGKFANMDLADSLALLSQTAADGAIYAKQFEELVKLPVADRDAAARKMLPAAALGMLEHVKETTAWYGNLLGAKEGGTKPGSKKIAGKVVLLRGEESWLSEGKFSKAEEVVRDVQSSTFQKNADVASRAAKWVKKPLDINVLTAPGGHFGMLRDPDVTSLALRLCRMLDESS